MTSLIESYDAVAFTLVLEQRLTDATARLAKVRGLSEEKGWLDAATTRLTLLRGPYVELLQKAARLPELEVVRSAQVLDLQNVAVDAVERLQAGITFHTGSRMPLLDSLFGKLKFASLRRADQGEFEKFCADFEKRLNTQYAKRLLVTPAFEFAIAVIEQVHAAFAGWRAGFNPEPLPDAEAAALVDALREAAEQLEGPLRQVRLLAEAALVPVAGAFEESGLGAKPKKRAVKGGVKEPGGADLVEVEVEVAPVVVKRKARAAGGKKSAALRA